MYRSSYPTVRPTFFGPTSYNQRGTVYRQLPSRRRSRWQGSSRRYRSRLTYAPIQERSLAPVSAQALVTLITLVILSGWLVDALLLLHRGGLLVRI